MTARIYRTLTEVDNLKVYSLVLGLLTCWFITHPHRGITHDALLYTVQALSRLYPEAYKNDLFIRYGFQDNYTIFSRLYAFAISWLGQSKATNTLMLIGYALWLSASFFMARILLKGKSFWIFLALLFTLPGNYGSEGIFSYGEPFLTPRIFAEALTISSIAFYIQKRFFIAVAFLFSSLLLHPLVAGYGCIFLLIYCHKFELKKVVLKLLIAIIALMILAGAGVAPFSDLLRVMDKDWYDLVYLRNSLVFIDTWDIEVWNLVIFNCSIILSSIFLSNEQQRNVLLSILSIGIGCLLLSWLGTGVLHNVFIIKLQLWRAFWLIQWFAYLAMALLIANWESSSNVFRILLLCFITAWFSLDRVGGFLSLIVLLLFYFNQRYKKDFIISKTVVTFAYLLPVTIGSVWVIMEAQDIIISSDLDKDHKFFIATLIILVILKKRVFITIVFLYFYKLVTKIKNKVPTMVIVLLLLMILSSIIKFWSFNPIYLKGKKFLSQVTFKDKIPVDSVVYWQDSVENTWIALNRSCYASYRQGAAFLFSRDLSLKLKKRLDRLQILGVKDCILSRKERIQIKDAPGIPTIDGLAHVCYDPELNFVVLSAKFSAGLIDEYYDKEGDVFYYLYDCKYFRENSKDN